MLTPSPLFALVLFLFGTPVIAVASDITFDSPTNGTTWNIIGLSPRVNVSWHIEGDPLPRFLYSPGVLELYAGDERLEMWDSIDPGWTQTEITLPALLHSEIDKYHMHLTFQVAPQVPVPPPPVKGRSDTFSIVLAPIAD